MWLCWVTRSVSPFISHRLRVLFSTQSQTTASSLLNNTQMLNHTRYSWAFGIAKQVFTRPHYVCLVVKSESVIHMCVCVCVCVCVKSGFGCIIKPQVLHVITFYEDILLWAWSISHYSHRSNVRYHISFNPNVWMASISFKLNNGTNEILHLCDVQVKPSHTVCNLCVIFDLSFWFKAHIKHLIKFSHLHHQTFICPSLMLQSCRNC